MQLTGRMIVEENIITNVCDDGIQQQGVDVRLKSIKSPLLGTRNGAIPREGKTITPEFKNDIPCVNDVYDLAPGYYEVEFEEGCSIPCDCAMYFKTRSSLIRCGAEIRSGQFDGGFETVNMGAFLKVEFPISIEKGARVAQAIINETYNVDENDLYDGQWQHDNQRSL